ncbi:MAG: rRNA methyltransferase [Gemmatimonadetes bacterium]|nr:rRNA methyltransferase [Gemmatimonadota bacterium]
MIDRFVIVLHRPQDIVNIAGTVRAMANTGLTRLRLVRPGIFDAHRIAGIAHGTEPLIETITFFDTLEDAVADAGRIIGTTARRRTASYVWQHPREAVPDLLAIAPRLDGPVTIVFGPEDKGLANEELDLCDLLLVVPTRAAHPSLNLAQAVLLIGYELMLAAGSTRALPSPKRRASLATPAAMRTLFDDARTALETIEFFKSRNERMVMRSLRAILRRARLNTREAGLLRAMVIEVRKYFERVREEAP